MKTNNIIDIREALLKVSTIANLAGMVTSPESAIEEIREVLKPISAMHIRNCDMGTVEEQQERFAKYCRVHSDAHECGIGYAIGDPRAKCPAYKTIDCQLAWAQMPYEEGGKQ